MNQCRIYCTWRTASENLKKKVKLTLNSSLVMNDNPTKPLCSGLQDSRSRLKHITSDRGIANCLWLGRPVHTKRFNQMLSKRSKGIRDVQLWKEAVHLSLSFPLCLLWASIPFKPAGIPEDSCYWHKLLLSVLPCLKKKLLSKIKIYTVLQNLFLHMFLNLNLLSRQSTLLR